MNIKRIGISTDRTLHERFVRRCKDRGSSASSTITQLMRAYIGDPNIGDDLSGRVAALEIRVNEIEEKNDQQNDDGK